RPNRRSRVEEVDAELERLLDQRATLLLGQRPGVIAPVGRAERHAAEAQARDLEAGCTELGVFHGRCSSPNSPTPAELRCSGGGLARAELAKLRWPVAAAAVRRHADRRERAWLDVEHRRCALALPGRDIREHRRAALPRAAVLVDVAKQMQSRLD